MAHTPDPKALETAVVRLAEELLDDDRYSFSFQEAEELAFALGYTVAVPVIRALKAFGFGQEERPTGKRVRGYRCCSEDRFWGPGSMPSCGGSGGDQILGFAGQRG